MEIKTQNMQNPSIYITGFSDEAAEDFSEQLRCMQEFGVRYIELRNADGINVADFSREKTKEIRAKLEETGIQVSSIGSPIGKISIEDDFEPHFEAFKGVVETAHSLSAPYIRLFSFYIPEGKPAEEFRGPVLERLSRFVEYAEKEDIVLLHENEKGIYGDIGPRCLDIMEQLSGPKFRAVFDFANFIECGENTLECYSLLEPYIEYIHIKDVSREKGMVVPAGYGDGAVKLILGSFKEKGFGGFLSLEPHLSNFTGLQSLEKNAKKRETSMSQKETWKLALDSLKAILQELSWEAKA